MSDPKLADVINPKLAAQRRMEAEGQVVPGLPDKKPVSTASDPKFGKQWSPEERAKQNAQLAALLAQRR